MKIKADSILPVPSRRLFQKFDEFYEVVLPEEYKLFLEKNNGAIPITNVFLHNGREYLVERFLCLLEDPNKYEVEGNYEIRVVMTQLDGRIIEDGDSTTWPIIPIAALFAGDFICLDFRNSEIPSVVVWFHEESDELSPVTVKVAENITEFLSRFKE